MKTEAEIRQDCEAIVAKYVDLPYTQRLRDTINHEISTYLKQEYDNPQIRAYDTTTVLDMALGQFTFEIYEHKSKITKS